MLDIFDVGASTFDCPLNSSNAGSVQARRPEHHVVCTVKTLKIIESWKCIYSTGKAGLRTEARTANLLNSHQ